MAKKSTRILDGWIIRGAVGVFGAVLISVLGSALWEFVFRDSIVALGNCTLSLMSSLWGGYVDLLHRDIGKLRSDLLIVPIFIFVILILIFTPFMVYHFLVIWMRRANREWDEMCEEYGVSIDAAQGEVKRKRDGKTSDEIHAEIRGIIATGRAKLNSLRKLIYYGLLPCALAGVAVYTLVFLQGTYSRGAGVWADQSIEILRPYVSDHEHIKLRSSLRAISSAKQFYELEETLKAYAVKASVELPTFIVIRRKVE